MNLISYIMASSSATKRKHLEVENKTQNSWPRFLVMERLEGTFEKTSYILIHKSIVGMAGEPKTLKKMGIDKYLIETTKPIHSEMLLKTTEVANIKVKITKHNSLNSCKGVIKHPELKYCQEIEIFDEIKKFGASKVEKIR